MKKLILGLGLLMAFSFATNAQELITGPAIELDKDVHDYGEVQNGGDGTCEFTVTNIGTEPLIISRCKGSCGCTVPQCDKAPVAPRATSAIKVKYDTKRTGPINKSVTITSNAVNEPTKTVRIKGTVLAASAGTPVLNDGAPVNN